MPKFKDQNQTSLLSELNVATDPIAAETRSRGRGSQPARGRKVAAPAPELFEAALPKVSAVAPVSQPAPAAESEGIQTDLFSGSVSSIQDLGRVLGTSHLKSDLRIYPDQTAAACQIVNFPGNYLLQAGTGVGKSVLACMLCGRELEQVMLGQAGHDVLYLTPYRHLVKDVYEKALRVLDVAPAMLVQLGNVSEQRRLAAYAASGRHMFISTPEGIWNDIFRGKLDLQRFGLIVLDEVHKGVGNYAYVRIAKAAQAAGVRLYAASATPGSNKAERSALMKNLGLNRLLVIKTASTAHDEEKVTFKPEGNVELAASDLLWSGAGLRDRLLHRLRGQPGYSERATKLLGAPGAGFSFPGPKALEALTISVKAACDAGDMQMRGVSSDLSALGLLSHLHACLTSNGDYLFLRRAAEGFAFRLFYPHFRRKGVYEGSVFDLHSTPPGERLHFSVGLRRAFSRLSRGGPFEHLLSCKSAHELFMRGLGGLRPAAMLGAEAEAFFFEQAFAHYVARPAGEMKLPSKESELQSLLAAHLEQQPGRQAIIFTDQVEQVRYLAARLNCHLGGGRRQLAAILVGKEHMTVEEEAAYAAFEAGELPFLVANSALEMAKHFEGDISTIINYTPSNTGIAFVQRRGRADKPDMNLVVKIKDYVNDGGSELLLYDAVKGGAADIAKLYEN